MERFSNLSRLIAAIVLSATAAPALAAQDTPPAAPNAPDEKVKADEDRHDPEAMQIIARYIDAIGGEEALRKHKHRTIRGELSRRAVEARGSFLMRLSAPDRMLITFGGVRQGYDGKVAWTLDPQHGPMVFEGAQAADIMRQADFHGELKYEKNYKVVEYIGRDRYGAHEAHRIRLVDRHGKESNAFFDPETHLYLGAMTRMAAENGLMPMMTVVSEYREFDGVKMPTLTQMHMERDVVTMTIESVDHEEIPDSVYELPEPVAALVAQKEKERKERENEKEREGADGEGEKRS